MFWWLFLPMKRWLPFYLILWWCLAGALSAADLGETTEQVVAQHGRPTSTAQLGDRLIWYYPKGARVELVNDRVVDFRGALPEVAALPAPAPAAGAAVAKPPTPAKPAAVAKPVAPPRSAPKAGLLEPPPGMPGLPPEALAAMEPAPGSAGYTMAWVLVLLVGAVFHFGITIAALRVAYKIWDMDAFWSGTFAIAGIDVAFRLLCEGLSPVTSGMSASPYITNGVSWFIMIFTVRRFCINKSLDNSIYTAGSVKVVTFLLNLVVALAVLRLIAHGMP